MMAFTLEQAGAPVVKGGNEKLVDIYAMIIRDHSGATFCNVDVDEVLLDGSRAIGVKDMGTILPGHGGILDRVDSFLIVLPSVYAAYLWLGLLG